MAKPLQPAGFYWSGFLCLVLAVLKLMREANWSWWRVLLPFWAVLGHNILYITVGFVWLSFADDGAAEEATIPLDSDSWHVHVPGGSPVVASRLR